MPRPVMLKKLKLIVLWRPTRPSRTNTQKRCPFHYRELECKSRKSRNTWGNRQIWPWSTECKRAKANRVLPRESTGHSKHPLPTTQKKTLHMDIQFSSVQSLSRVRLCNPMNCSSPGLPVHHQLLEFTQTHVHRVSDAIQPSPLPSVNQEVKYLLGGL